MVDQRESLEITAQLLLDKALPQFKKLESELRNTGRKGKESADKIGAAYTRMTDGLNRRVSSSVVRLGAAFAGLATIRTAFNEARQFRTAMSEVSTIVDTSTVNMQELSASVRDIALAHGQAEDVVARGLYQAISSGAEAGAESLEVLEQSTRLAVAGVTEVSTAVDLLTTATNAYRQENLTAEEASDVLFRTVEKGKTTVGELAGAMGRVLPVAASLGVSMQEVAATLATLTLSGLSTDEAATSLRATLVSMLDAGADAERALRGTGISFDQAAIKANGLAGTLAMVQERFGGNTAALTALFPNVRALTGVLSVLNDGGAKLGEVLADVEDAAGATGVAFEKRIADPAFKAEAAALALSQGLSTLGDSILVSLAEGLETLGDGSSSFEKIRDGVEGFLPVVNGLIAALSSLNVALAGVRLGVEGLSVAFAGLNVLDQQFRDFLSSDDRTAVENIQAAAETARRVKALVDAQQSFEQAQLEAAEAIALTVSAGAKALGKDVDLGGLEIVKNLIRQNEAAEDRLRNATQRLTAPLGGDKRALSLPNQGPLAPEPVREYEEALADVVETTRNLTKERERLLANPFPSQPDADAIRTDMIRSAREDDASALFRRRLSARLSGEGSAPFSAMQPAIESFVAAQRAVLDAVVRDFDSFGSEVEEVAKRLESAGGSRQAFLASRGITGDQIRQARTREELQGIVQTIGDLDGELDQLAQKNRFGFGLLRDAVGGLSSGMVDVARGAATASEAWDNFASRFGLRVAAMVAELSLLRLAIEAVGFFGGDDLAAAFARTVGLGGASHGAYVTDGALLKAGTGLIPPAGPQLVQVNEGPFREEVIMPAVRTTLNGQSVLGVAGVGGGGGGETHHHYSISALDPRSWVQLLADDPGAIARLVGGTFSTSPGLKNQFGLSGVIQ